MSVSALVAAYDGLGQALYSRLAAKPGNIVLSPLSIGTALAMALAGARGETADEMASVLGHRMPVAEIEAASRALIRMLESYASDDTTHVAVANALLLDRTFGDLILPSYRERLATCFGAEVKTGASAHEINAWVKARTMGLVPKIVDAVHPETAGAILNTVAFAAAWAAPFDPAETGDGKFVLGTGDAIEVPMMRHRLNASVCEDEVGKAIRLPFSRPNLELVCAIPRQGAGLEAIENIQWRSQAGSLRYVDLAMPKFRIDATVDLVPPLSEAGLRLAFSDAADFGGIAPADPGVKIDQIRHGACLKIDEAGCAAAAATALGVAAGGISPAPPEPEAFAIDRPFVFYLVDEYSGATLMRGRVVDPRA